MEILVAVNSKEVSSALRVLISQNGYKDKIIEIIHLTDLLKKLKSTAIKLVLIDWEFFDGDTIEMIILFKKAYSNLRFILLGIKKKDKKAAIEANIDAFYLKSDPPKDLISMITEFRNNNETV